MSGVVHLHVEGPHSAAPGSGGRWILLSETTTGQKDVPVTESPFIIGRSQDCQLVLPEAPELRTTTSRWHCHLRLSDGRVDVVDGSAGPVPGTAGPKPSISGTRVNGLRIAGPTELREGDLLEVGPWRLRVGGVQGDRPSPMADDAGILGDVVRGERRSVDLTDPRLGAKFGQLHELVFRLAQTPAVEDSLTAILAYATSKMPAAEAAAILLAQPAGGFAVRLAWQKNMGRLRDFRCSASLLAGLPPEQSFLLRSKLTDRSASQSLEDISSGLLLPLWGKGERLGILYLDNRRSGNTFTDEDLYLGSAIASLVSLQLSLERQGELASIEANMARYFAPDVVERIVEQSAKRGPVGLEVAERDVTVMFVDMEGFTALSRTRTPQQITELLNPYFETVARAIQQAGGHVNKFIGDAVMGIFGAQPGAAASEPGRHAIEAVTAALLIPAAWEAEAGRRGLPATRLRVGLNSGRVVVGNIGYSARLEYSVLGDAVNIASRLEKLAPPGRALVSEATRQLCRDRFDFEDRGVSEVRGVGPLRTFVALGERKAPA
ncbi:MAG: FHA domain-containing protein [Elusimicrobia bacterium]|nr:FHA domain-containing protein [Elusimicrobiota bacterium]